MMSYDDINFVNIGSGNGLAWCYQFITWTNADLFYFQLDPWKQTLAKFKSKYKNFHTKLIWKYMYQPH